MFATKAIKQLIKNTRQRRKRSAQSRLKEKLLFPDFSVQVASPQRYRPRFKYSVVTAAYGVEAYLDEYFSSLLQQSVGFCESIQVIVVDDGSTDATLEKARSWERRYPENIKVVTQENGGPAAARNTGLAYIKHEWVTFTDPDDFLAKNYFEVVDRAICHNLEVGIELEMIACRAVFYGSSRNPGKDRNKNASLRDDVSATKHIHKPAFLCTILIRFCPFGRAFLSLRSGLTAMTC